MRKILLLLIIALFAKVVKAQVVPDHDTVYVYNTAQGNYLDNITPLDSNITLKWHIDTTTFPADWIAGTAFCDNAQCYLNMYDTSHTPHGTAPYMKDSSGAFLLAVDFSGVLTLGTYYITVAFTDTSDTTTLFTETFIVNLAVPYVTHGVGVATVFNEKDISLYPNPANDNLTVSVNDVADITRMTIYDIYGKQVMQYPIQNKLNHISMSGFAAGTYFIRFYNNAGTPILSRRFTHM